MPDPNTHVVPVISTEHIPALPQHAPSCAQGHEWQATLFIGYYQCARCDKLAACQACVSKVRGKALVGYCRAHQHLGASATEQQEVLG